jgi:hypothetical protein
MVQAFVMVLLRVNGNKFRIHLGLSILFQGLKEQALVIGIGNLYIGFCGIAWLHHGDERFKKFPKLLHGLGRDVFQAEPQTATAPHIEIDKIETFDGGLRASGVQTA